MNSIPFTPVDPHRRTPIIDVLRGWALLSVVLVNFAIFFSYGTPWPGIHDLRSTILQSIVQIVFLAKGWTMLAFLFGYGFSVLMQKVKATQKHPYLFFSWRMALLLLIAIFNSVVYYGDILKDYVILGMVILFVSRFGEKAYLRLAVACFILLPALIPWSQHLGLYNPVADPDLSLYSSHNLSDVLKYGWLSGLHVLLSFPKYFDWNLVMLVCGLLGAYAQRVHVFESAAANRKLFRNTFFVAFAVVVALGVFHQLDVSMGWGIDRIFAMERWFQITQTAVFGSALCWLYSSGRFRVAFQSLELIGKMTLTNYLLQNILALALFSGLGLNLLHRTSYAFTVEIAAVVFVLQVFFSHWWLSYFRFGPVEWLWRCLAYGRWFPNVRPVYGIERRFANSVPSTGSRA
jgi:uncharacterized protein